MEVDSTFHWNDARLAPSFPRRRESRKPITLRYALTPALSQGAREQDKGFKALRVKPILVS